MYKYVLNSVAKFSLMFAQYFEYYAIILRGPIFRGYAVVSVFAHAQYCQTQPKCFQIYSDANNRDITKS